MIDNGPYIQNLQDSISYMDQPAKDKLNVQLADVALLRTFFENWQATIDTDHDGKIDDGKTSKQGYEDAISKLPKPQNGVPNSGVTESQLLDKIKWAFGKPLEQVDQYDVKKIETDVVTLTGQVRRYLGLGFFFDSQITDKNDKIRALQEQDRVRGEYPDANTDTSENSKDV